MTYNHLTISELSFIQNFWNQGVKAYIVAKTLKRSAETIYRVFRFLDAGYSISEYYENYRANKSRSGRKPTVLPNDELEYIKEKVSLGWTPDTIIGRNEKHISCSMRTLYRIFKRSKDLDVTSLPMKGKRHPNGLLRKDGLGKDMDLSNLSTDYVQQVASYRNNIPRKSLNYRTPLEVFIKYITNEQVVFF